MNSIHPTAEIVGDVTWGAGITVSAFARIVGPVQLGDRTWIGTGVVIGAPPEVRSVEHPPDALSPSAGNGIVIGSDTVIREYAQIHQGWQGTTRVGDGVFIMNQVYVAHDCAVEDGATLAGGVLLAGHVRVGRSANIGLGAAVHQRRYVGDGAMVGMGSVVTRDIVPFSKAYGNPARMHGVNSVGLRRAGVVGETVAEVERLYAGELTEETFVRLSRLPGLGSAAEGWLTHAARAEQ
ncbi:MAG: acyl-ACP--UDP-N- acetylglucosamine O-acyltransferase [Actinobacteria bacterium]|nr:acyl-ACP--UDP-N- acetylglucosamine O-acyltransferase [Actinomycetota bacterium]